MCVRVRVSLCLKVVVCACACLGACVQACVQAHVCACVWRMSVCECVCARVCTGGWLSGYVCLCVRVGVYVCAGVPVCVCERACWPASRHVRVPVPVRERSTYAHACVHASLYASVSVCLRVM